MDDVFNTHEEIIITKRNKPIVRVVHIPTQVDPFGFMKDSVIIKGDIISYDLDQLWEAEQDE